MKFTKDWTYNALKMASGFVMLCSLDINIVQLNQIWLSSRITEAFIHQHFCFVHVQLPHVSRHGQWLYINDTVLNVANNLVTRFSVVVLEVHTQQCLCSINLVHIYVPLHPIMLFTGYRVFNIWASSDPLGTSHDILDFDETIVNIDNNKLSPLNNKTTTVSRHIDNNILHFWRMFPYMFFHISNIDISDRQLCITHH